jgi:phage major head subunit gpT-like protein
MPTFLTGHDYSQLGERGIRGVFLDKLENSLGSGWARRVGLYFKSDSAGETHRWLGQVAALRQWVGARLRKGQRIESLTITNVPYEGTLGLPLVDVRRDKTGTLKVKGAQDLAVRANEHWDELATSVLTANPTCYDGQSLFSDSHSSGSSGTHSNDLDASEVGALNVVNTAAITKDEARSCSASCPTSTATWTTRGSRRTAGRRSSSSSCRGACSRRSGRR